MRGMLCKFKRFGKMCANFTAGYNEYVLTSYDQCLIYFVFVGT